MKKGNLKITDSDEKYTILVSVTIKNDVEQDTKAITELIHQFLHDMGGIIK